MSTSPTSILRRNVSSETFEQLCFLCQQIAEMAGKGAIFLTEAEINSSEGILKNRRFCLVVSSQFQVLLVGEPSDSNLSYKIKLTYSSQEISQFIARIPIHLPRPLQLQQLDENIQLYSKFSLQLVNLIAPLDLENIANIYPPVSVCKPVEDALERQVAQEQLLNQTIAQLHKTLELSIILETAVREVRNYFQADRLLIYQFQDDLSKTLQDNGKNLLRRGGGKITYESKGDERLISLLNFVTEQDCFTRIAQSYEKYCQGSVVAIEDVETAYSSSFCLAELLRKYQVKSKLIAPIVVKDELWGLIIAHQCFEKRQWLDREKDFLRQIAEHLAVTIYQAQLYAEVQKQKETFEQRVIERTRELRDILLAAQSAHRSKSEFLGNVSHELRTPLTSVIGLSGTLLHCSQQGISLTLEQQQRYLKMIQESGQQLLSLINEMIDFSQIEAGKAALKIQEISLKKLAQKMWQNHEQKARTKKIDLKLDLKLEIAEDRFCADPEKVQQILFHLLANAIKFTPESGTVILRIWRENNHAIFQIEDTGIGIAKQHLPLLFEKFQQLERSRERIYGGTGLGLALTKQLVELHQGRIEVESTPGKGSLFTVWLPNQTGRLSKNTTASSIDISTFTESKSVILVVNNEEIATLMCELLTAANYKVVWLIDGSTATKQIELLQPNVVIIDCDLPEVYLISQALKHSGKIYPLKILLLSEQIASEDWQTLQQNGIDDYLLKPIQPNLFLERIEALL